MLWGGTPVLCRFGDQAQLRALALTSVIGGRFHRPEFALAFDMHAAESSLGFVAEPRQRDMRRSVECARREPGRELATASELLET